MKRVFFTFMFLFAFVGQALAAAPDPSQYAYVGEQGGLQYYAVRGSMYRSTIRNGQGFHDHGGHSAYRYKILAYAPNTDMRAIMTCVIDIPCALYAENSTVIYDGYGNRSDGPSFDLDLLQPIPQQSVHAFIYRQYVGR